jgi:hypothetical protein
MSDEDDDNPFSEFAPTGVVRREPKRANAKVDADGRREYTQLNCPHGCNTTLEVLSSNYKRLRNQVIGDHLADEKLCPHYTGQRPHKSTRGGMTVNALTVKPTPTSRPVVALLHRDCNARYGTLEQRVSQLEDKGRVYDAALQAVLPTIELPLMQGRAEQQLRIALPTPVAATTTLSTPAPVMPVILDIDSLEMTRKAMNDMYQELCAAKMAIGKRDRQLEEKERQRSKMERLWQQEQAQVERLQRRVQELKRDPSYRAEMRGEHPAAKRPHLAV